MQLECYLCGTISSSELSSGFFFDGVIVCTSCLQSSLPTRTYRSFRKKITETVKKITNTTKRIRGPLARAEYPVIKGPMIHASPFYVGAIIPRNQVRIISCEKCEATWECRCIKEVPNGD
jgi:hypothetical protein